MATPYGYKAPPGWTGGEYTYNPTLYNQFGIHNQFQRDNAGRLDPGTYKDTNDYVAAYLSAMGMDPRYVMANAGWQTQRPQGMNDATYNMARDAAFRWAGANGPDSSKWGQNPAGGQTGAPPGPMGPSPEDDLKAKYDAFYKELESPLDLTDPRVMHLLAASRQSSTEDARRRGITGPMAVGNAEQAYTMAQAGLLDKNRAMRSTILGQLSSNAQEANRLQLARDQFGYGVDMDAWKAQQAERERTNPLNLLTPGLGILGGVIGSVGGPMGAAAGAGIGSSVGAGLSQMFMPRSAPPPSAYNYRSSGGGGYTPYGRSGGGFV